MTTTRRASAIWHGTSLEGKGAVTLVSSAVGTFNVSWPARSQEPNGQTSPEELLGAAHAACFSMALSSGLTKAGTPPTQLPSQPSAQNCPDKAHHCVGNEFPSFDREITGQGWGSLLLHGSSVPPD